MKRTMTILITGVGSPGAPGVIKSLRSVKDMNFNIIGVDMNRESAGKGLVDTFIVGPKATDPDFVEKLLGICTREKVEVILPMVSQELPTFSAHSQAFQNIGTQISVSKLTPLNDAMNKGVLFQILRKSGFSVPQFEIVQTVDDLRKAIHQLGYPELPVCLKPTISDGSRGFRILDVSKNRFDFLYHDKPNSSYISEQELFHILNDYEEIPETIVMEYLPNEEYSVDLLANNGEVVIAIPRLRQEIMAGISVKSLIEKADDVINYTTDIVKTLGLHGNIGVQVRRDAHFAPKIIEINPRIQGTIVHCTAAGVNLPYLAIKLAKGMPITQEELSVKWGSQMIRYWNEVFFDRQGLIIDF